MPVLTVGTSGQQFTTLSAAIAASADGDVIQVQAGTYTDDFATINTKITIEGIGGMVHLQAVSEPPNGKGILTINTDVTLSNIEFSGAQVGDGNGAGIRYQGGNLVINNCFFHDNQDGLLATPFVASTGSITINNSEFTHNGAGDGFTHNLYVGEIASLNIQNSTFTNAVVGHEIKSNADNTTINNSVILDGPTGSASYSIDLAFGGNATITNNFIQQGPLSENPAIISVGESGNAYAGSSLFIANNTIVNDLVSNSSRVMFNSPAVPVTFTNNSVFGLVPATISTNPITESGTTFLTVEPQPPCFAEGTLIGTDRGEIPIEDVRVGDCVPVLFGTPTQRVVWIGKRRVDCRSHPARAQIWPVLVFAGAFGPGQPRRNLWLSPEHAVYVDDVLVPVRLLINHSSIVQVPMSTVTYYHLELERHDVLLAEGLPVESYLETGNRAAFADPGAVITLHPDFALRQWEAEGCAPLVMDGPKLAAARQRVNAMAADAACA